MKLYLYICWTINDPPGLYLTNKQLFMEKINIQIHKQKLGYYSKFYPCNFYRGLNLENLLINQLKFYFQQNRIQ